MAEGFKHNCDELVQTVIQTSCARTDYSYTNQILKRDESVELKLNRKRVLPEEAEESGVSERKKINCEPDSDTTSLNDNKENMSSEQLEKTVPIKSDQLNLSVSKKSNKSKCEPKKSSCARTDYQYINKNLIKVDKSVYLKSNRKRGLSERSMNEGRESPLREMKMSRVEADLKSIAECKEGNKISGNHGKTLSSKSEMIPLSSLKTSEKLRYEQRPKDVVKPVSIMLHHVCDQGMVKSDKIRKWCQSCDKDDDKNGLSSGIECISNKKFKKDLVKGQPERLKRSITDTLEDTTRKSEQDYTNNQHMSLEDNSDVKSTCSCPKQKGQNSKKSKAEQMKFENQKTLFTDNITERGNRFAIYETGSKGWVIQRMIKDALSEKNFAGLKSNRVGNIIFKKKNLSITAEAIFEAIIRMIGYKIMGTCGERSTHWREMEGDVKVVDDDKRMILREKILYFQRLVYLVLVGNPILIPMEDLNLQQWKSVLFIYNSSKRWQFPFKQSLVLGNKKQLYTFTLVRPTKEGIESKTTDTSMRSIKGVKASSRDIHSDVSNKLLSFVQRKKSTQWTFSDLSITCKKCQQKFVKPKLNNSTGLSSGDELRNIDSITSSKCLLTEAIHNKVSTVIIADVSRKEDPANRKTEANEVHQMTKDSKNCQWTVVNLGRTDLQIEEDRVRAKEGLNENTEIKGENKRTDNNIASAKTGISELYHENNTYLDLSITGEREKQTLVTPELTVVFSTVDEVKNIGSNSCDVNITCQDGPSVESCEVKSDKDIISGDQAIDSKENDKSLEEINKPGVIDVPCLTEDTDCERSKEVGRANLETKKDGGIQTTEEVIVNIISESGDTELRTEEDIVIKRIKVEPNEETKVCRENQRTDKVSLTTEICKTGSGNLSCTYEGEKQMFVKQEFAFGDFLQDDEVTVIGSNSWVVNSSSQKRPSDEIKTCLNMNAEYQLDVSKDKGEIHKEIVNVESKDLSCIPHDKDVSSKKVGRPNLETKVAGDSRTKEEVRPNVTSDSVGIELLIEDDRVNQRTKVSPKDKTDMEKENQKTNINETKAKAKTSKICQGNRTSNNSRVLSKGGKQKLVLPDKIFIDLTLDDEVTNIGRTACDQSKTSKTYTCIKPAEIKASRNIIADTYKHKLKDIINSNKLKFRSSRNKSIDRSSWSKSKAVSSWSKSKDRSSRSKSKDRSSRSISMDRSSWCKSKYIRSQNIFKKLKSRQNSNHRKSLNKLKVRRSRNKSKDRSSRGKSKDRRSWSRSTDGSSWSKSTVRRSSSKSKDRSYWSKSKYRSSRSKSTVRRSWKKSKDRSSQSKSAVKRSWSKSSDRSSRSKSMDRSSRRKSQYIHSQNKAKIIRHRRKFKTKMSPSKSEYRSTRSKSNERRRQSMSMVRRSWRKSKDRSSRNKSIDRSSCSSSKDRRSRSRSTDGSSRSKSTVRRSLSKSKDRSYWSRSKYRGSRSKSSVRRSWRKSKYRSSWRKSMDRSSCSTSSDRSSWSKSSVRRSRRKSKYRSSRSKSTVRRSRSKSSVRRSWSKSSDRSSRSKSMDRSSRRKSQYKHSRNKAEIIRHRRKFKTKMSPSKSKDRNSRSKSNERRSRSKSTVRRSWSKSSDRSSRSKSMDRNSRSKSNERRSRSKSTVRRSWSKSNDRRSRSKSKCIRWRNKSKNVRSWRKSKYRSWSKSKDKSSRSKSKDRRSRSISNVRRSLIKSKDRSSWSKSKDRNSQSKSTVRSRSKTKDLKSLSISKDRSIQSKAKYIHSRNKLKNRRSQSRSKDRSGQSKSNDRRSWSKLKDRSGQSKSKDRSGQSKSKDRSSRSKSFDRRSWSKLKKRRQSKSKDRRSRSKSTVRSWSKLKKRSQSKSKDRRWDKSRNRSSRSKSTVKRSWSKSRDRSSQRKSKYIHSRNKLKNRRIRSISNDRSGQSKSKDRSSRSKSTVRSWSKLKKRSQSKSKDRSWSKSRDRSSRSKSTVRRSWSKSRDRSSQRKSKYIHSRNKLINRRILSISNDRSGQSKSKDRRSRSKSTVRSWSKLKERRSRSKSKDRHWDKSRDRSSRSKSNDRRSWSKSRDRSNQRKSKDRRIRNKAKDRDMQIPSRIRSGKSNKSIGRCSKSIDINGNTNFKNINVQTNSNDRSRLSQFINSSSDFRSKDRSKLSKSMQINSQCQSSEISMQSISKEECHVSGDIIKTSNNKAKKQLPEIDTENKTHLREYEQKKRKQTMAKESEQIKQNVPDKISNSSEPNEISETSVKTEVCQSSSRKKSLAGCSSVPRWSFDLAKRFLSSIPKEPIKRKPESHANRHKTQSHYHPYKKVSPKPRRIPHWSFDLAYSDLNELLLNMTLKSFKEQKRKPAAVQSSNNDMKKRNDIRGRFYRYKFQRSQVSRTPPKGQRRSSKDDKGILVKPGEVPGLKKRAKKADSLEGFMGEGTDDGEYSKEKLMYESRDNQTGGSPTTTTQKSVITLPGARTTATFSGMQLGKSNEESDEELAFNGNVRTAENTDLESSQPASCELKPVTSLTESNSKSNSAASDTQENVKIKLEVPEQESRDKKIELEVSEQKNRDKK